MVARRRCGNIPLKGEAWHDRTTGIAHAFRPDHRHHRYDKAGYPTVGVSGKLLVIDAGGGLHVTLQGLRVGRQTAVYTSDADDRVTFDRCRFLRPLSVRTFEGTDTITATGGTSFRQGHDVSAGGQDEDTVTGF